MDSKKLVLVDGHSILNRAFYGMPDLTNAAGLHTGAVIKSTRVPAKLCPKNSGSRSLWSKKC